jgi:hypothetical protein
MSLPRRGYISVESTNRKNCILAEDALLDKNLLCTAAGPAGLDD